SGKPDGRPRTLPATEPYELSTIRPPQTQQSEHACTYDTCETKSVALMVIVRGPGGARIQNDPETFVRPAEPTAWFWTVRQTCTVAPATGRMYGSVTRTPATTASPVRLIGPRNIVPLKIVYDADFTTRLVVFVRNAVAVTVT